MGGGLWFWAKKVLVGSGGLGVSRNFPGKSSPSSPYFPSFPLFLPLTPFLQFFLPSNASLQLSSSGLHQPLLPFLLPFLSFDLFLPTQGRYWPLSEHPRNPSIGPKRLFLGLFKGFPPKPLKGPKTPFLGPF